MDKKYFTLITGASEGFGKALAIECAKRGMNLILIALPGSELDSLVEFLRESFHVIVFKIEKDLLEEKSCYEIYDEVDELELPVNMLINNAGIGGTFQFAEESPAFMSNQIKVNILSTTLLTRLFLDKLKACGKSYILNVSSLSCLFYLPRKCVYGSTKSFIFYFSKSLRAELKPYGINVSVICPGGMNTNSEVVLINRFSNWITTLSIMNPEDVAPIAIDGLLKNKELIIPGKLNKFYRWLNYFLPSGLKKWLINHEMNHLHGLDLAHQKKKISR